MRAMYFCFEPLATFTAIFIAIFLICTIKFRWFHPDKYLPPPFNVEDVSYCAVCLDYVNGGDKCRELPKCGHAFHAECVDAWLERNWTCPICRKQVTDELPKRLGENTIFSFIVSRCQEFIARINTRAEELMTVLFESGVLGHP
ncbi:E3 ubiquitin-protein ligase ATL76-like [Capsicum galapagoense]